MCNYKLQAHVCIPVVVKHGLNEKFYGIFTLQEKKKSTMSTMGMPALNLFSKIYIFALLAIVTNMPKLSTGDQDFSITKVTPSDHNYWVEAGNTVVLSCETSEKFNLCKWQRPDGVTCSIIVSSSMSRAVVRDCDNEKTSKRGEQKWSVRKSHDKRCDLELTNVTIANAGEWQSHLSSFPDANDRYLEAQVICIIQSFYV